MTYIQYLGRIVALADSEIRPGRLSKESWLSLDV